ncbi:MAG: 1-acyl-sn-glycerol-3-phosphate acyltransferase [Bryobacteraceae bacterium]|nr:1-acyl-sn-glycerol-3-phosphate acyltransferase [Bryobacteraceae bacterium]
MIRVLRSVWIWSATAVIVVLWVPLLWLVIAFDRDPLRRRTARWFRRLGPAVARVNPAWNVIVSGQEQIVPGQVYVVVSNHQSLADIPLVAHLPLEAKWLGKAELLRVPVFGWMMRVSRDIGVDRDDRRKAAHSFLRCVRTLQHGLSIITFPEGTRSRTGDILPFSDGPFQLALREKVSVLPLVVEGTGTALPRASWMFGPTQNILLRVLAPVPSSDFDEAESLRDTVRSLMQTELEKLRQRP